jgi:hypothetical protein
MKSNTKTLLKAGLGLFLLVSMVAPMAAMAEDMPGWRPDMPGWRPYMPGVGNNPLDGTPPPYLYPQSYGTPGYYYAAPGTYARPRAHHMEQVRRHHR